MKLDLYGLTDDSATFGDEDDNERMVMTWDEWLSLDRPVSIELQAIA